MLQDYAQRLLRLARGRRAGRARAARGPARPRAHRRQRGGGALAAAASSSASAAHPQAQVDVRRVPSRAHRGRGAQRSLDFGVLTFQPAERGLQSISLGRDELVMLAHPEHPLAGRKPVTMRRSAARRSSRTTIRRRRASGCCGLRAAHIADQHPDRAAEPRRHQARGRDGAGRRAAAAALRARRDRARQLVAIKVPEAQRPPAGAARLPARATCRTRPQAFLDVGKRQHPTCGDHGEPSEGSRTRPRQSRI